MDENAVGEEDTGDMEMQPLTLAEKLEKTLHKSSSVSSATASLHSALSKEFAVFEATGQRTYNLQILHKALLSIQPTSVESERAFSAAGLFITKLRSRLSDKSVNAMCVLRDHFKRSL